MAWVQLTGMGSHIPAMTSSYRLPLSPYCENSVYIHQDECRGEERPGAPQCQVTSRLLGFRSRRGMRLNKQPIERGGVK